jgi:RNA polymerase sigma factor (sigma-70 family)
MLVEDHASLRRPLAFLIEREPDLTVVAEAGTLADARRFLVNGIVPDATLLDLDLPDGSGVSLIPELRAANRSSFAVVLSGTLSNRTRAEAVAAGAAAVFSKTTDIEELIAAVRRICDGEVLVSPAEAVALAREVALRESRERDVRRAVAELTPREREILNAFAEGLSDKQIAERLSIGDKTVRNHVASLLSKLDADSRLQALVLAIRHGVIRIE